MVGGAASDGHRAMPILEMIGLEKRFAGIVAVNNISLAVEKGGFKAMRERID